MTKHKRSQSFNIRLHLHESIDQFPDKHLRILLDGINPVLHDNEHSEPERTAPMQDPETNTTKEFEVFFCQTKPQQLRFNKTKTPSKRQTSFLNTSKAHLNKKLKSYFHKHIKNSHPGLLQRSSTGVHGARKYAWGAPLRKGSKRCFTNLSH